MKNRRTRERRGLASQAAPLFTLSLSLLMSAPTAASTSNSLGSFFDDLGYNANVSHPSAFKGQSANYYSGGSLFVRSKIVDAQLVNVTVPAVSAGCSGIDMFMGGFSHISSDQLVKLGKAIIHNAPPFVTNLALQTWAPQLKQNLDNLQAIADKWLNQSVNSCEAAQAAVGGLAAFAAPATKKHVCATLGTQNNAFSDWVAGQQECGAGGASAGQLAAARNDPAMEDMTQTNHNIVWSAIMKNGFISADTDLAQFMMSLSGTFVYDNDGKPRYYASLLADNNNLIQALLEGGKVSVYSCKNKGEKECITLTKKEEVTISKNKGIEVQIQTQLEGLLQAIVSDNKLTDKQKGFLEFTKTPILKIFIDSAALDLDPDIASYARVIAVELLNRYLINMLTLVQQSLQNTNNSKDNVELIIQDITQAKRFTNGLADKATKTLLDKNELISAERMKRQRFLAGAQQELINLPGFEE